MGSVLFRVITCSYDPLEIAFEGFGKVLFHSQLSEGLPSLHARPFVTELSARQELVGHIVGGAPGALSVTGIRVGSKPNQLRSINRA